MYTPLVKQTTGLILIDVQEKLYPHIHEKEKLLEKISLLIKGLELFSIPIIVTEQYPKGLGKTIPELKKLVNESQGFKQTFAKTHFSCVQDDFIKKSIKNCGCNTWILAGIESHICVLQTAYDLIQNNFHVVVPEDATSSRTMSSYLRGIKELESINARVSSIETILFEIAHDSQRPEFKELSKLVR